VSSPDEHKSRGGNTCDLETGLLIDSEVINPITLLDSPINGKAEFVFLSN